MNFWAKFTQILRNFNFKFAELRVKIWSKFTLFCSKIHAKICAFFKGVNLKNFVNFLPQKFTNSRPKFKFLSKKFTRNFTPKNANLKSKFTLKNSLKFTAFFIFFALFLSVIFIYFSFDINALQKGFESRYSKVLLDKNEQILSAFINESEQWHLSAKAVPKRLEIAVIEYEDKDFYSHFGVDFSAIARAFLKNFTRSKKSGASTISMQVVKLFEKNERTYLNKFGEIIKAIKLDATLNKSEILSLYLNNAPYGGNLVGFASAILFYFDKAPSELSWSEAALLAVLPNAPGLMNLEKNKATLKAKRDRLLRRLFEKNYFNETSLKLALAEPLPRFKPRKNHAAHLAVQLLNDEQRQVVSSIDKNLQVKFEQKTKEFAARLNEKGIKNVAVLLADTKSYKALAYVGSQDFYDENLGQVNGVIAKRSVGSTLKPFLYALAIDEGLICGDSLLLDVPTFFANFSPQNANKKYYGLVRAKEALQRSLNVPFVSLLQSYGYEKFFFELKKFVGFEDEDYARYGLSLILGTKEMSLVDLVKLYLALGNYGKMAPLSFLKDENLDENSSKIQQIFSPGAAYLTLDALQELKRAGLEQYNAAQKLVAWKTGTSYGRKDAWAMGTTPRYTLGVWVGNFTGEANANLFGVSVAGELFFELLGLLDDTNEPFAQSGVKPLKIDAATGYRYDLNVSAASTLYPNEAKALRVSPFLKKVYEFNGRELNSLDRDFASAKSVIKLNLPENALAFFSEAKISINSSKNVKILYPKNALRIVATRDLHGSNALIVRVANLRGERLFWYLNGALIFDGTDKSHALNLSSGKYELFIISQSGESDKITFWVEKNSR